MSKHHIAKLRAHAEWACDLIRKRGAGDTLAISLHIEMNRVLKGTKAEGEFVHKSVLPILAIEIADRHFLPKRKFEHRVCKKRLRLQLEECAQEQKRKHKMVKHEY